MQLAWKPLAQFGDVKRDAHYGNFDRCDFLVDSAGSPEVDVELQFQTSSPPENVPIRTEGQVTIAQEPRDGNECDRILSFGSPSIIDVSANGQRANLCDIADVAAYAAAAMLGAGAPLSPRTFLPQSLAHLDACSLLDAAALGRAGVDGSTPEPEFGNWGCSWGRNGGRWLHVRFDQHPPLASPDSGTAVQFEPYTGFVQVDGDGAGDDCVVRIEYRPFTAEGGSHRMELVDLALGGPEPPDSLCGPATAAASAVAFRLTR
jgi:hypothetical protein